MSSPCDLVNMAPWIKEFSEYDSEICSPLHGATSQKHRYVMDSEGADRSVMLGVAVGCGVTGSLGRGT